MSSSASLPQFLARLGVERLHRPLPNAPALRALLAHPALDAAQREGVEQAVGELVADERAAHGYRSQDVIALHPGTPGLEEALARFDKPHTHDDDEVRFILEGEGLFGFFDADGTERVLRVGPGDYLRVPAGVEHRFTLTSARRIKALRLFVDPQGWAARYTGRPTGPLAQA